MKVICIDTGIVIDVPLPIVGEIYTVVREATMTHNGVTTIVYVLAEMPQDCGYGKANFIPLSSIDETQFERNYKKELA